MVNQKINDKKLNLISSVAFGLGLVWFIAAVYLVNEYIFRRDILIIVVSIPVFVASLFGYYAFIAARQKTKKYIIIKTSIKTLLFSLVTAALSEAAFLVLTFNNA